MSESFYEGDLKLFQEVLDGSIIKESGGYLVLDNGLENAILISILTNRRASTVDEVLEENKRSNDKQGWWGDALSLTGRKIGSKLWMRQSWKRGPDLLEQCKQDIEECLAWMIEDKIADKILVRVTSDLKNKDRILFYIDIIKNNIDTKHEYYYNWKNQILGNKV